MKNLFIIFFLFTAAGLPLWVSAQIPAKEDSFRRAAAAVSTDTARLRILFQLGAWQNTNRRFTEAGKTSAEMRQLAEKINFEPGRADALWTQGNTLFQQGLFIQAKDKYEQALKVYDGIKGFDLNKTKILHGIASCFISISDYPNALKYFNLSKQLAQKIGKQADEYLINSINGMGGAMMFLAKYKKAEDYYREGLREAQKRGVKKMIPQFYLNLGAALGSIRNIQEDGLPMLYKCIEIANAQNDFLTLANAYNNLGSYFEEKKDYTQALRYYTKGYQMRIGKHDKMGIIYNLGVIGDLYLKKLNQPHKALPYFRNAYDTSIITQEPRAKYYSACSLAACLSQLGKYNEAYQYMLKAVVHKDSLVSSDKTKELGKLEAQFAYEKQTAQKEQEEKLEKERRLNTYYVLGGIFAAVLFGAGFLYYRFRTKARSEKILIQYNQKVEFQNRLLTDANHEISSKNAELLNAYEELNATLDHLKSQKNQIETKNLQIEDSIRYAYRIQTAILPDPADLKSHLPPHFIFYQPRDIVSGDFYWFAPLEDGAVFVLADCTGHGVPGAFMSVVAVNALHRVVNERQISRPDLVLLHTDEHMKATLRQQNNTDSNDGMDAAVIRINKNKLLFAGAGRPLWHLRAGNLTEYKGNRFPVGGAQHGEKSFTLHEIDVMPGDRFFIFTDGITDQFGGPEGKKLTPKRLNELIIKHKSQSLSQFSFVFHQFMNDWMTGNRQLDDRALVCFEV